MLAKISDSGCKFSTLGILEISLSYKNVHELIYITVKRANDINSEITKRYL